MARKAKMRRAKGWAWVVWTAVTMAVAELPRVERLEVEVDAEPALTARARSLVAKTHDVQEIQAVNSVSADSVGVWAQMDAALAAWTLVETAPAKPIGWSMFGVDAKTRPATESPGVPAVELEWWLTPDPVWSGGPLGRLRSLVNQERIEGRGESADRLQQDFWRAYGEAVERRKVFQEEEPERIQRRPGK